MERKHSEMSQSRSPYEGLPETAYWRTAVSQTAPLEPGQIYTPKFPIDKSMKIATAGSCFAQHVGAALRQNDFNVIDAEPLVPGFSDKLAHRYGFRLYSARYGNLYTVRQLFQLLREAEGEFRPVDPIWERDGRYFDALRPSVEPDGLPTATDVTKHREQHLKAVRSVFNRADLVVFTLGLTEAWISTEDGTTYPTAPGTIAGHFDPARYAPVNFTHAEVLADFEAVRERLKAQTPDVKFLVTVSPVPLTATASGNHVEVATCSSKATLRSVCGELVRKYPDIDYFPSFEIITSVKTRGAYYEANLRNVSRRGVATAMATFLAAHGYGAETDVASSEKPRVKTTKADAAASEDDVICEEALLEAFAK